MRKSSLDQARSGLLLGAKWVAAILWISFVAFGTGMAFSDSPDRRVGGWACLFVAALVAVMTAEVWIRILPGLLGIGIINAGATLWEGHSPTGPSEPIPRGTSITILLLLIGCSALAMSFQSRKLTIVDKFALLAFLVSQVLAIAWFPSPSGFGLMMVSLLMAWVFDRTWGRKAQKSAS